MLIYGSWLVCDDGVSRPIVRGEIQTAAGEWLEAPFLVDTGADRTVFSAAIASMLGVSSSATPHQLMGVGGVSDSVLLQTALRLTTEAGTKAVFQGQFPAFIALESLDICVIGRDITNLFAVVVDRPREVVCLIGQRHGYVVQEQ
jgi:predicted aspartyl protease